MQTMRLQRRGGAAASNGRANNNRRAAPVNTGIVRASPAAGNNSRAVATRGISGSELAAGCSTCSSCGCDTPSDTSDKVCCAPCSCRPVKGIKQFRQGIVMTGCGKPPGACGFNPDLTCGQTDVSGILENLCAPSAEFCDPVWYHYRSIAAHPDPADPTLIVVDGDPIAYDVDPTFVPTLMYPESLRHGVNFLYESWIDPCTCSWWRLRYDSCGRPLGYEQKQYDTAADLEQALKDLRGFDSDTNNNAAAEDFTSFVLAGVPSQVNLDIIGSTPPFIVTGRDFGYQVFVLDTATGRYRRDENNTNCTRPFYPTTCCDGAQFVQYYYSGPPKAKGEIIDTATDPNVLNKICYEFSAATCRYYVCGVQDGADLPEVPVTLCILQCCWSSCRLKTSLNAACPDAIAKPSLCCKNCCP